MKTFNKIKKFSGYLDYNIEDTSGPSLNILVKLMSMVAIVMAGLTVAWSLF